MSTRTQRGRVVRQKQTKSLTTLYIIVGVVALLALAGFGIYALQNQQQANAPEGVIPTWTSAHLPTGVTEDGFQFKGREDAPVTVIEYADFQCPGCAYYTNSVEMAFDREYVETGKVKFVYHEFPLRGHPNAVPAAEAARCAADQGAFWKMHDMLFANQRQWSGLTQLQAQFTTYARQIGLDPVAFGECFSSGKYRQAVLDARAASEALQLTGTPSFSVNGVVVDTSTAGSVDDIVMLMRQAVERELANQ
ncbi:MAG: thioredoxin domain-containing protein [Chloroflexota bacterium]